MPVDGNVPCSLTLVVYTKADVPDPMVATVHEPVGAAMVRGPGDGLLQRLQRQVLGAHGGGARPAHDPAGEHVGGERRVAETPVGHAHVGDVGHVRPVGRLGPEPAFHQVGPAAGSLRRSRRHRALPRRAPRIPSPRMTASTWSRPSSPGSQPLPMSSRHTLRYPYTAEDSPAWMSRMSRASASWRAAVRLGGLDLNMRVFSQVGVS